MKRILLTCISVASISIMSSCIGINTYADDIIIEPLKLIEPFPYDTTDNIISNESVVVVLDENERDQFKDLLQETKTKYANCETIIYKLPNINSDTYGNSLINTSFEVILEFNEWSKITTEDGYAYILTSTLQDEPVKVQLYTEEELYIMAHLLAGEAQYCDDMEQRYVGSVVLNRIKDNRFPNTLKEVVFQKNQYSCTKDGNYYREPTESNWRNATWILENGSILPDKVIYQSGGKQGKGIYLKTKYHCYCY